MWPAGGLLGRNVCHHYNYFVLEERLTIPMHTMYHTEQYLKFNYYIY